MIAMAVSPASSPAAGPADGASCGAGETHTASGCATFAEARRHIREIVKRDIEDHGLRAALVRVDLRNRTLATASPGESMNGVPANLRMHFRTGSIAIPYLIDLVLMLQEKGRLSLDDPVSRWLPDLPNADRVTLRMLASNTSGYPDWIQENQEFLDTLYSDVFRQWRTQELLNIALARPLICEPGECFHYAHTNFIVLSKVVHEVTGRSVAGLLRQRVLDPLRLRDTNISSRPDMPGPVLHSYTTDRGPYEDATFWSPSWTIAESMITTATIGDIVKSARAAGTGALLSPESSRERFEPVTAGFPPFNDETYYALGILVSDSWQFQNPNLNGWAGISAYLPSRQISLGIVVTRHKRAAENSVATGANYSNVLFEDIADYLTPNHSLDFPS